MMTSFVDISGNLVVLNVCLLSKILSLNGPHFEQFWIPFFEFHEVCWIRFGCWAAKASLVFTSDTVLSACAQRFYLPWSSNFVNLSSCWIEREQSQVIYLVYLLYEVIILFKHLSRNLMWKLRVPIQTMLFYSIRTVVSTLNLGHLCSILQNFALIGLLH